MVAATFPNLSFENPPGTGPTLLSANAEPYSITDGTALVVTFAGVGTTVVFLESDFVDITAATAAEVAALLTLRIDDLTAADDGGFVRLTSDLTGEDVALQVTAGGVNDVLGFPTTETTGTTYAGGPPNGWAVAVETYSVMEWADFADENDRPEEVFAGSTWLTIADPSSDYSSAIFDLALIPTPIETFSGWSSSGYQTSFSAEQGSFGSNTYDSFEVDWGSPTYFEFVAAFLTLGITDPLETGWGQSGAPTYDAADFANATKTADDFEGVVDTTHLLVINTGATGDWVVTVFSEKYVYPSATTTASTIATGIAAVIDGGSVVANATANGSTVYVSPANKDTSLAVTIQPPSGGQAANILATAAPEYAEEWVGQDQNPDFD